ncbi:hypothetical protein [Xylophilus sp. GOD-11R]|uniref:hypothetical protein n=1 Tax=Xylophilus sp. GOD-11R TaxID=3089814 RepID=UPI00298BDF3A|nr:hypothetical protein [Xylophilus sp. GOD-11R]WPB58742.1 hypothetical protein R9X41_08920 [Xylophilus sp. GOD-11R]
MKTFRTLAFFSAAAATLAFAGTVHAQGTTAASTAEATAISRAEVEADRNLWLRSGLAAYAGSQAADDAVPGYTASKTAYRAARSGPSWQAELARVQGRTAASVASVPATSKAE